MKGNIYIYHLKEDHEFCLMTHSPRREIPKDDKPAGKTHGIADILSRTTSKAISRSQVTQQRGQTIHILHEAISHMGGGCPHIAREQQGPSTQVNDLHTVAKDLAVPYPFARNPHLLITCNYSGSNDK
jgi:hypothetical protein